MLIKDRNVSPCGLQEGNGGRPSVQRLAHPRGDEFLLPFARLLASVCKLPGQSRPCLVFCGPENRTIIFFPSIIQRAEVWGNCQGSAIRGCNKMCGSLLRRGCFRSYKSIHTNPQPPDDRHPLANIQGGAATETKQFLGGPAFQVPHQLLCSEVVRIQTGTASV